jgi:hypothetical protein
MANEVKLPSAAQLVVPEEKNVFEKYADAVGRNRIVGELLKFSKGEWLSGRDGDEVAEGTRLVAGCDGLEVGWVKWLDFKPVEQRMGRVAEGFMPARRSELDDPDPEDWPLDEATGLPRDPWQLSNSVVLMDPETQQLFTFPSASKGGIGALGKLAGAYGKHIRQKPNELPLVELSSDSYKHSNKAFGKIYTPLFVICGWVDRLEFDEMLAGEQRQLEEVEEAEDSATKPAEANKSKVAAKVIHKQKENAYAKAKSGGESGKLRSKVAAGKGNKPPF